MSTLNIQLLGSPQIRYEGKPLSFRSAKALALLAYLAVEGGMHPRDTLAVFFWPESDASRARANLRNTLNYLRNALLRSDAGDTPHLIIERNALGFNVAADYFLDVEAVRAATETRQSEPMQRALSLYRGDFLAGFSLDDAPQFDDWTRFQRVRWRRQLSMIFERLAHYQAENSRIVDAVETATQWLAHDPLDEAAHRQMMQLLAQDGRRHDALAQYERCRTLLEEELGVEPDPRTVALATKLRQDDGQSPFPHTVALSPRHNLPSPVTPFIGRTGERSLLRDALGDPATRLVTLIGPGGVGKTRLALQAARESIGRFLDGVWLASLEEAQDVAELVASLANVLGLQFVGRSKPQAQLIDFLREREMLLVLDNFEQLLPEGAAFLADLLRQSPAVVALVASRERLNLRLEKILPLNGLPHQAAQELFVTAARRADATFTLEPEMETAVAHICEFVGGLPLGLEMAAAWIRMLPLDAIADELEGGLDLLSRGMHDAPARHHSLHAVFDASWQRLNPVEKATLRALSIFHGGFTRAAAGTVAGASLPLLATLVDKSLVGRQGRDRFILHPLFREYAADKLRDRSGKRAAAVGRHRVYYLDWLGQQEPALLHGERSDAAIFREIEADIDNMRAAWRAAVNQDRAQAVGKAALPLGIYYDLRGRLHEWRSLLDPAIVQLEERNLSVVQEEALGRLLVFQGLVASRWGEQEEAQAILQRAVVRLDAAPALHGLALNYLAVAALQQGELEEARTLAAKALARNEECRNLLGVCLAYNLLGITAGAVGEQATARQYLEQAVAQWRTVQSKHGEERALIHLGYVTYALGEIEQAREYLHTALSLGEEINDQTLRPLALGHLGRVNLGQGRTEAARRYFKSILEETVARQLSLYAPYAVGGLGVAAAQAGDAETAVALLAFFLHDPLGYKGILLEEAERALAKAAEQLETAVFTAAQARGERMTMNEIMALLA